MTNTIRTFIAIKILPEEELIKTLAIFKKSLASEKIKWVEPNNLHLTLKFVGDTSHGQVEEIKNLLENISNQFGRFSLTLNGLGFFKSKGQPRVLFAKLEYDESLELIYNILEERLSKIGIEKDKRDFKPHLTLARIKYIKNKRLFYSVMEKLKNTYFQKSTVSEIHYFQSVLKPTGPVYQTLKVANL